MRIFHAAAAGIIEGVARDLGNSGGYSRLILRVETQQPGDLAGSLPRGHGIALASDGECKNGYQLIYAALATTTVVVIAAPGEIPV